MSIFHHLFGRLFRLRLPRSHRKHWPQKSGSQVWLLPLAYPNKTQAHLSLSAHASSPHLSSVAISFLCQQYHCPCPAKRWRQNWISGSILEPYFWRSQILYPTSRRLPSTSSSHRPGCFTQPMANHHHHHQHTIPRRSLPHTQTSRESHSIVPWPVSGTNMFSYFTAAARSRSSVGRWLIKFRIHPSSLKRHLEGGEGPPWSRRCFAWFQNRRFFEQRQLVLTQTIFLALLRVKYKNTIFVTYFWKTQLPKIKENSYWRVSGI